MKELEDIQKAVPDTEVRNTRRIEIGSAVHQGDVYVHRVPEGHPRGERLGTTQVAVGSGIGSRHCAEGEGVAVYEGKKYPEGFKVPQGLTENALLGRVVEAPGPWTLTHPEHAHHNLPPGTYQVTYQADLATMARVVD